MHLPSIITLCPRVVFCARNAASNRRTNAERITCRRECEQAYESRKQVALYSPEHQTLPELNHSAHTLGRVGLRGLTHEATGDHETKLDLGIL
ncbi:hypothetical protein SERLA73DRAFT_187470 [Serpula lacrymans var. lacrymans S7.3]|uniref:Uncharacterized protein n=1 Tax=Serpula lacrymans var. lacrymans (strain S7.3) TaxID=936435 RepID=F8Q992_SERL3|nr:hypothetical protein SERLA73DRAFT_187470 [Serpula lacrymans var. lacrymans S7.3]